MWQVKLVSFFMFVALSVLHATPQNILLSYDTDGCANQLSLETALDALQNCWNHNRPITFGRLVSFFQDLLRSKHDKDLAPQSSSDICLLLAQLQKELDEEDDQPQQQQQPHEVKREYVMLGKKQRFHSWGGKRNLPLKNAAGSSTYFI